MNLKIRVLWKSNYIEQGFDLEEEKLSIKVSERFLIKNLFFLIKGAIINLK